MKKRYLFLLLVYSVIAPVFALAKDVTVKDVKDSANDALNSLDKGIHSAGGEAKKGGNSLLQSLDDAIKRLFHGSGEKKEEKTDKK